MANFTPTLCGDNNLYMPDRGCTDCEKLEKRVEALEKCCAEVQDTLESIDSRLGALETLLNKYSEVKIVKIDDDGRTVTAYVLGRVEVDENPITFSGLTPLEVNTGEEFDPLDGVSATGCNDTDATVTVESEGE